MPKIFIAVKTLKYIIFSYLSVQVSYQRRRGAISHTQHLCKENANGLFELLPCCFSARRLHSPRTAIHHPRAPEESMAHGWHSGSSALAQSTPLPLLLLRMHGARSRCFRCQSACESARTRHFLVPENRALLGSSNGFVIHEGSGHLRSRSVRMTTLW